jgi:hypothetical protein
LVVPPTQLVGDSKGASGKDESIDESTGESSPLNP